VPTRWLTTYHTSNVTHKKTFLYFNPAKTKALHVKFARKKIGRDYKQIPSFIEKSEKRVQP